MHRENGKEKTGEVKQRCERSLSEITIGGITHPLATEQRTLHNCRYSGFNVYTPVNSGSGSSSSSGKTTSAEKSSETTSSSSPKLVTIPVKEIVEEKTASSQIDVPLLTAWTVASVFLLGSLIMALLLILRRRKVQRRKRHPKQTLPDPKARHDSKRASQDNVSLISGIYAEIDESQVRDPKSKEPLLVADRPKNEYITSKDMGASYLDPREIDGYLAPQDVAHRHPVPGTSKIYSPLNKLSSREYGSLGDSIDTLSSTKDSVRYKKNDDGQQDTSASLNNYFVLEKEDDDSASKDELPNNYFILEKVNVDSTSKDSLANSSSLQENSSHRSKESVSHEHLADSGYVNDVDNRKDTAPVIQSTNKTDIDEIDGGAEDTTSRNESRKDNVLNSDNKRGSGSTKLSADTSPLVNKSKNLDATINNVIKPDGKSTNSTDTAVIPPSTLVLKSPPSNAEVKNQKKGATDKKHLSSDSSVHDDDSVGNETKPLLVKAEGQSDKNALDIDKKEAEVIQSPGDNERQCLITTV